MIGSSFWICLIKSGMTEPREPITLPYRVTFSRVPGVRLRNHNFLHHGFGYAHCVSRVNRFVSAQTDNFQPHLIAAETTF